jgi:hypothetical protein
MGVIGAGATNPAAPARSRSLTRSPKAQGDAASPLNAPAARSEASPGRPPVSPPTRARRPYEARALASAPVPHPHTLRKTPEANQRRP